MRKRSWAIIARGVFGRPLSSSVGWAGSALSKTEDKHHHDVEGKLPRVWTALPKKMGGTFEMKSF